MSADRQFPFLTRVDNPAPNDPAWQTAYELGQRDADDEKRGEGRRYLFRGRPEPWVVNGVRLSEEQMRFFLGEFRDGARPPDPSPLVREAWQDLCAWADEWRDGGGAIFRNVPKGNDVAALDTNREAVPNCGARAIPPAERAPMAILLPAASLASGPGTMAAGAGCRQEELVALAPVTPPAGEAPAPRVQIMRSAASDTGSLANDGDGPAPSGSKLGEFEGHPVRVTNQVLDVRIIDDSSGRLAVGTPKDSPLLPPARHSADFRSVHWYGTDYCFTEGQAAVVAELWKAWENGTPDVGHRHLRAQAKLQSDRLADLFKEKGQSHPAWGTMIQSGIGTKGTARLCPPKKPVP
jgi:hypothetical protein